jgi:RNA-directed DNA polymerase
MAMHTDLPIHKAAFDLLTQASHSEKDRAKLANLILKRGHAVNGALTKTYPKR